MVTIPADLRDPVLYELGIEANVDDDRKMDARISFETRGDWEVLFRIALMKSSLAQLQSTMEAAAKKSSKADDFAITEVDSSDPYNTSIPFHLGARITATLPQGKEKKRKENSAPVSSDSQLDSSSLKEFISLFLPEGTENQALKLGDPKKCSFHMKLTLGPELADKVAKKWKAPNAAPVHFEASSPQCFRMSAFTPNSSCRTMTAGAGKAFGRTI